MTKNPLKEGEQFNLMGYSTGSVINAQSALILADEGYTIDNLILIAPTIPKESYLWRTLNAHPNIKNIIRIDIPNDNASLGLPAIFSFLWYDEDHAHFKYAFGKGSDEARKELAKQLKDLGVSDYKLQTLSDDNKDNDGEKK